MNLVIVLTTLAIAQTVFLALIVALLFINRNRSWRRQRAREGARTAIELPVQQWLASGGSPDAIRSALRQLRPDDAVAVLIEVAERIPGTQQAVLAASMRNEAWVSSALAQARAGAWWRRLSAARLLSVVGTRRDLGLLRALLRDVHPAVQSVAAAALPRLGGKTEIAIVLDALPTQSPFVQRTQYSLLAETWVATAPLLRERLLDPSATASQLVAWIPVAETLGTPELLEATATFFQHPAVEVRVAVTRALRRYYHPTALVSLRAMLVDEDWRVRAKAAQALGTIGGPEVVGDLARALPDAHWWVRFRTALALAQLGEPGREALRAARASPDRYVAEMASMIAGLAPGGLVELSEG